MSGLLAFLREEGLRGMVVPGGAVDLLKKLLELRGGIAFGAAVDGFDKSAVYSPSTVRLAP